MKRIVYFFLFILSTNLLIAQQDIDNLPCSDNPFFQTTCNGVIGTGCPTWSDICSGGWIRSHGSPQFIPYTIIDPKTGASFSANNLYMWHINSTTYGEGAFRQYNFKANRPYKISLRVNTSSLNGSVNVYAANGLVQSVYNNCGNPIPTITQKQLIGTYSGSVNQWSDITLNFVPTIDYNQLWIYPQQTSNINNGQYEINVSYFQACPTCEGNISYYNPSLSSIPINDTRAGNIYVGSQSGLEITNVSSSNTRLIATGEIVLSPTFEAKATSTGSLFAGIYPCGYSGPIGLRRIPISSLSTIPVFRSNESSLVIPDPTTINNSLNVFPTLTNRDIYIDRNRSRGELLIRLFNQSGMQVYATSDYSITNLIRINVSRFPPGLYYLVVSDKKTSKTAKIMVMK